MSDTSLRLLTAIRRRLRAALRRQTAAEVAFGALVLVGVLALLLLAGAAAEAVWWLGSGLRGLWLSLFVVAAVGLLGTFVVWPLLRLYGVVPGRDERTAAAAAGLRFPEVGDRLAALLDLADGRRSDAPPPLVDRAVTALGSEVEHVPFERIEDTRPARRAAPWAAVPVLGVLAFLLLAPTAFTGATYRLFNPAAAFDRPAPFRLDVAPGDVERVRGDSLTITALPVGSGFPATATLVLSRPGETRAEPVRVPLAPDGAFRHTLRNLRSTLTYRVETAGVTSPEYTATVVSRPLVRGLRVTLRPPRYTGLPAQRLAPGVGDVAALPGTRVEVAVRLGDEPVEEAALVIEDVEGTPTDSAALDPEGMEATGAFALAQPGSYRIHLENADGFANEAPVRYRLDLLRDEPPQITLQGPGDTDLADELRVPVQLRVTDDFGFRSLTLHWRLTESRYGQPTEQFEAIELPIDARTLDQQVLYDWFLAPTTGLDLTPGDAIAYYVEVRDNDTVRGPKAARSGTFTLRLPSLAERYEALDRAQEETEDTMEQMREEADDARRRFEELRDQLRRDQQPDYEDRRQLERLQNQQESLDEQAQQLSEQMQELLDQMQQENLVDEETQQLYEEMQRVIDEIQSPELREALEKLQEAMENMDLPQMMQAMEEFEFNEEQFRERLERALELFKKLEVAQELDEAARRAEELARTQEALQEQTEALEEEPEGESESAESEASESEDGSQSEGVENPESGESGEQPEDGEQSDAGEQPDDQQPSTDNQQPKTGDQLAEEQERAAEEMRALEEALRELQEKMEALRDRQPAQEMEQMREQLQQQQLPQQMQQNSQQLQQQQLQDAQQGQQQMQQQLQNLQQQLQEMSQQMQGQQQQINAAALRRVLDDVLTLSEEQEALGIDAQALTRDSPALRPMAQQQVGLADGLATVADTLSALAREIPQMTRQVQTHTGGALREMGLATEELAERRPPRAAGHQLSSMTHLNDLALLLSELLDQLMNNPSSGGGGGMSMQQMMQQMQQGQQQLGDQIQQMLNDMAGQRLSGDQQRRLEQMARQQQQIREQLQQLMEQGMEDGTLDAQLQSQLQRIAEEMEEAARELQRGRLDRRSEQRQQQILERLLQAEESINQRGKKQEREGQSGEEYTNPEPPPLPPRDAEADRLRRDLIRALESGYAPDYQDLIKRYFERLQERVQPQD